MVRRTMSGCAWGNHFLVCAISSLRVSKSRCYPRTRIHFTARLRTWYAFLPSAARVCRGMAGVYRLPRVPLAEKTPDPFIRPRTRNGQLLFGLCDQFLAGVEVTLLAENPRPFHRWVEDMVRLSSAGESDLSWHGWRLFSPAGAMDEKTPRPLYSYLLQVGVCGAVLKAYARTAMLTADMQRHTSKVTVTQIQR